MKMWSTTKANRIRIRIRMRMRTRTRIKPSGGESESEERTILVHFAPHLNPRGTTASCKFPKSNQLVTHITYIAYA